MADLIERAHRVVSKIAKSLARDLGGSGIGGAVIDLPDGGRGFAWAAVECDPGDLVLAADALLRQVEDAAAEGALDCPGCAERWNRVAAARAMLRPPAEAARTPHGH